MANAVTHTSGQPFAISFRAGGPHAQEPAFGAWLEQSAAANGNPVHTEKAGINSIVVGSTDNLRGMLENLAFSLTLHSGQMCTVPQNLYVPEGGIDTDEGHLSSDELGEKPSGAVQRLPGDDAKAVELLGASVNDQVRTNTESIATEAGGRAVLDSRRIAHPAYADAVARANRFRVITSRRHL